MRQDTRSKNSTRNITFSIIAYMVQLILSFLGRRYFIYYFSTEYLGLNSLFSNIISILSLAELGFGAALVFAMYKPMATGDEEKVRQLLGYYRKCYYIIGCIIITLGLLVLPFMEYFKAKAPNVDVNLYIVYLIMLFNTVVSYFFAHRRSLLYTSQRQDIESKITIITKTALNFAQLLVILLTKNYYLYISLAGIFALVDNFIVFFVTQKHFPEFIQKPLSPLSKEDRKAIRKNIFALIFHKIGGVIVFCTDSLLIYMLFDAEVLGVYSNYLLITTAVTTFVSIFISAITGSVGNAVAKENPEYNYNLLGKLNFLYFMIVSFCTICIFVLCNPFISVALDKSASSKLLVDDFVRVLICMSFYFTQTRRMVSTFKDCKGLFYEHRFSPIFESIINLVASLLLARVMGLGGVILGTIISTVFVPLWVEPYVTNKHYFKKSTPKYFLKYALYTLCMLVAGGITTFVLSFVPAFSVWTLILKFGVCALVAGISLLVTMSICPEYRQSLSWGKNILKNSFSRKKDQ